MEVSAKAKLRSVKKKSEVREVALVGFGDGMDAVRSIRSDIPIWTLNAAEEYNLPRIDALFEMHPLRDLVLETHRINNLKQEHPYPIYTLEKYSWAPASVMYPIEALRDEVFENIYVGEEHANYWDSSIPYMIALAVHEGFDIIYMYGFGLMTDTEYTYQRPGAMLFIGWAAGKGAKVVLPKDTQLIPETRYGYDDYQSISRQNIEQWLRDLQLQESDFQGRLNVAHASLQEKVKYGAPQEEIQAAEEKRLEAWKQMYMRAGAIEFCLQAIQIMDRKREAMEVSGFKDHFFVVDNDGNVKLPEEQEG